MNTSQDAPDIEQLIAQLARVNTTLSDKARHLDRALKAAKKLAQPGALVAMAQLEKYLPALRECPTTLSLEELPPLVSDIEAHLEHLRRFGRHQIIGALRSRAIDEGLSEPALLAEQPPTLFIAPFTCELDLDRGEARLLFAREIVTTAELEVDAIYKTRAEAMARIQDEAIPASEFFSLLHTAYRTVLMARGKAHGERVDLVDLLAPIALLRNDVDAWRKLELSRVAAFPRYLMSYQLRRLRKERALEKNGLRLELGTATGGSTRNKTNVLFLPTRGDEGQYYLSLCFRRV